MVLLLDLQSQLQELKQDYVRLQDDLEKRESTGQEVDPLVKQLEQIENSIALVRAQIDQQS